jgi:very-short-patch-repair endonuclease
MYKYLFNNQSLKNRRRELRKNQTDAEEKLWELLRNKKLEGFKFIRQYSVGPYILDFYCPKARLGIELDGGFHAKKEVVGYDKNREKGLEKFNIKIIRFWNNEIVNETPKVLDKILNYIKIEG